MEPTHSDIVHKLGQLEGKVDLLLAASDRRDGRYNTHDKRIIILEKHKNINHGAHVVLATFAAMVGWPTIKTWLGL